MSSGLSWHEHQILNGIEDDLRSDPVLERALRTMHAPPRRGVPSWAVRLGARTPAVSVVLLVGFAVALTFMVAQIGQASSFAFLGVVWGVAGLALGAKVAAGRRPENRQRNQDP